MSQRPLGREFEEMVRSVARARWQLPPGGGNAEKVAGADVDVVCRTEDVTHLIMVTTDRKLEKVTSDGAKLTSARRALDRNGDASKAWIVTFYEPTHDQQGAAKDLGINILSLDQFRATLVNTHQYLEARSNYRFGSASDPEQGTSSLPVDEYVQLPISDEGNRSWDVPSIVEALLEGTSVVMTGPFGAGKSLTVREIFYDLKGRALRGETTKLPLAINLREHWGQDDIAEVLIRHGRRIGYSPEHQLVRGWHAGQFVPLLDGFDELLSRSWRIGPEATRAARRESLAIIRDFVGDRPRDCGVLIAGRSQYFDNSAEMRSALALGLAPNEHLTLSEFTDDQAVAYLKRKRGGVAQIPEWLPRKPLLLSYLAARHLLDEVLAIPDGLGAAFAWDQFLDRICAREAEITQDIDGGGVRRLLEILATRTRMVGSRGQVFQGDLTSAYASAAGVEPSEDAMVLLGRLPGLTARDDSEAGARNFVDEEMLDALRGSAVAGFVRSPFEALPTDARWEEPVGGLGVATIGLLLERWDLSLPQAALAARQAVERWQESTLALDIVTGAGALAGTRDESLDLDGLAIADGLVDVLDLESMSVQGVALTDCLVGELVLPEAPPRGVSLQSCLVERVVGVSEERWLPDWIRRCDVEAFDPLDTNAAIMGMSGVPLATRTLLTALRKLYIQRGAGRKESAFLRGIGPSAQSLVSPVLSAMEAEGLAKATTRGSERIWHPDRRHQGRVLKILAEKERSDDPVVRSVQAFADNI